MNGDGMSHGSIVAGTGAQSDSHCSEKHGFLGAAEWGLGGLFLDFFWYWCMWDCSAPEL